MQKKKKNLLLKLLVFSPPNDLYPFHIIPLTTVWSSHWSHPLTTYKHVTVWARSMKWPMRLLLKCVVIKKMMVCFCSFTWVSIGYVRISFMCLGQQVWQHSCAHNSQLPCNGFHCLWKLEDIVILAVMWMFFWGCAFLWNMLLFHLGQVWHTVNYQLSLLLCT